MSFIRLQNGKFPKGICTSCQVNPIFRLSIKRNLEPKELRVENTNITDKRSEGIDLNRLCFGSMNEWSTTPNKHWKRWNTCRNKIWRFSEALTNPLKFKQCNTQYTQSEFHQKAGRSPLTVEISWGESSSLRQERDIFGSKSVAQKRQILQTVPVFQDILTFNSASEAHHCSTDGLYPRHDPKRQ